MTKASSRKKTVTQHEFVVPTPDPWGGTMSDLGVAMTWAKKKAEGLGISTGSDDWARLTVTDDELVITVTETKKETT